jgi:hypothetical protein
LLYCEGEGDASEPGPSQQQILEYWMAPKFGNVERQTYWDYHHYSPSNAVFLHMMTEFAPALQSLVEGAEIWQSHWQSVLGTLR